MFEPMKPMLIEQTTKVDEWETIGISIPLESLKNIEPHQMREILHVEVWDDIDCKRVEIFWKAEIDNAKLSDDAPRAITHLTTGLTEKKEA